MTTTDSELDDMLKELDDTLAIAPADDFASRVRGRIVAQKPAARAWWWRQDLAVAAAVLLVVGGSRLIWDHGAASTLQGRLPASEVASVPTFARDVTLRASVDLAIGAAPPVPFRATTPKVTEMSARVTTSLERPSFEVLVPEDDKRALEQLVRAIQTGQIAVPAETQPELDADGRMPKAAPIDIPLIPVLTVSPPMIGGLRREQ